MQPRVRAILHHGSLSCGLLLHTSNLSSQHLDGSCTFVQNQRYRAFTVFVLISISVARLHESVAFCGRHTAEARDGLDFEGESLAFALWAKQNLVLHFSRRPTELLQSLAAAAAAATAAFWCLCSRHCVGCPSPLTVGK